MRILITIQHPAHVHFYRHAIAELQAEGHEIAVFARENDLAVPLLEAYGIDHEVLAGGQESMLELARVQLTYEARLLARARQFEPDVMTAIGGIAVSHVAPLVGAKSIVFIDNEGITSHRITVPFAHTVCTPAGFRDDYGKKHVRYNGFHELAYLHPDRFEPSPERLRAAGVDPEDRYFVLRFRKWDALHDVGELGLSRAGKRNLVEALERRGEVYITSGSPLPPAFEPYRLPVAPQHVHDLLAFADCYGGDSATMATEAAVLGTPAVRVQSFAGENGTDMSNFVELEERYGLLFSTAEETEALRRVAALVDDPTSGERFRRRRKRLLEEKIDVTAFLVNLLSGREPLDQRITTPLEGPHR